MKPDDIQLVQEDEIDSVIDKNLIDKGKKEKRKILNFYGENNIFTKLSKIGYLVYKANEDWYDEPTICYESFTTYFDELDTMVKNYPESDQQIIINDIKNFLNKYGALLNDSNYEKSLIICPLLGTHKPYTVPENLKTFKKRDLDKIKKYIPLFRLEHIKNFIYVKLTYGPTGKSNNYFNEINGLFNNAFGPYLDTNRHANIYKKLLTEKSSTLQRRIEAYPSSIFGIINDSYYYTLIFLNNICEYINKIINTRGQDSLFTRGYDDVLKFFNINSSIRNVEIDRNGKKIITWVSVRDFLYTSLHLDWYPVIYESIKNHEKFPTALNYFMDKLTENDMVNMVNKYGDLKHKIPSKYILKFDILKEEYFKIILVNYIKKHPIPDPPGIITDADYTNDMINNVKVLLNPGIPQKVPEIYFNLKDNLPSIIRNTIVNFFIYYGIDTERYFDSKHDTYSELRVRGNPEIAPQPPTLDAVIYDDMYDIDDYLNINDEVIDKYFSVIEEQDPEFFLKLVEDPEKSLHTFRIVLDQTDKQLIRNKIKEYERLLRNASETDKKDLIEGIKYYKNVLEEDVYNNKYNKYLRQFRKDNWLPVPRVMYFSGYKKHKNPRKKSLKNPRKLHKRSNKKLHKRSNKKIHRRSRK